MSEKVTACIKIPTLVIVRLSFLHYVVVCVIFKHTQLPKCHSSNTMIIKADIIYPKDHLVIFIKSIADNSLVMLAPP